jgi:hypothetical protein
LRVTQNRVFNLAHSEIVGGSAVPAVQVRADGRMTLLTRLIYFTGKNAKFGTAERSDIGKLGEYSMGIGSKAVPEKPPSKRCLSGS